MRNERSSATLAGLALLGLALAFLFGTRVGAQQCAECKGSGCDCLCLRLDCVINLKNGSEDTCTFFDPQICRPGAYSGSGDSTSCEEDDSQFTTIYDCTGTRQCTGCNSLNGEYQSMCTKGKTILTSRGIYYYCASS
jgi:hypothetical protein